MTKIHFLLDKKKQEQARRYEKEKRTLGLAGMALSLIILLSFYSTGLSGWAANLFIGSSIIWTFIVYWALFLAVVVVISFPLNFYSSYSHEHKWKFSNQTVKTWLWEKAKSLIVSLLILYVILGLLFWIMAHFLQIWWLIAGIGMALVGVIFATIFPVVILPIFNKYTPIQDKELTDHLEKTLSRGGLRSSGFFKEDTSRQTKKENAYLAGLGRTRRVVLGDNLMKNMTVPEIESIIAHEVGHLKRRHIWKNIMIGTIEQLAVFYAVNLAMKSFFPQFLSSTRRNLALFPFFVIFAGAISGFLFGPLRHAVSRHFEKQSDQYALENIKDKKAFMTALAGLADRNLSNAYPEWWVKLLYYSHPPIGERLRMGELFKAPCREVNHVAHARF
jgi:STE24 endopeptidase